MTKPAAFLDRDGTLNLDKGYVHTVRDFEWLKESKEAIKLLNDNNFYVIVVTNQSGIARGYYNEEDVIKLHNYMNTQLKKLNAHIDDFFYSPYHPQGLTNEYDHLLTLRKPNIGMLELAQKKWNIDKDNSFMIGDKIHDVECGKKFGIKSYLFDPSKSSLLGLVNSIIN